eukprot:Sspe_Gene.28491::Locus_12968_Transcript_1_3_Confidence_0.500_Length_3538::g.28491::m.28491
MVGSTPCASPSKVRKVSTTAFAPSSFFRATTPRSPVRPRSTASDSGSDMIIEDCERQLFLFDETSAYIVRSSSLVKPFPCSSRQLHELFERRPSAMKAIPITRVAGSWSARIPQQRQSMVTSEVLHLRISPNPAAVMGLYLNEITRSSHMGLARARARRGTEEMPMWQKVQSSHVTFRESQMDSMMSGAASPSLQYDKSTCWMRLPRTISESSFTASAFCSLWPCSEMCVTSGRTDTAAFTFAKCSAFSTSGLSQSHRRETWSLSRVSSFSSTWSTCSSTGSASIPTLPPSPAIAPTHTPMKYRDCY